MVDRHRFLVVVVFGRTNLHHAIEAIDAGGALSASRLNRIEMIQHDDW